MKKKPITVIVDDFVNFQIEGLSAKEIGLIRKQTSYQVKGSFTTAAFKAGIWDGRESLFTEDGIGVLSQLEKVLSIVENELDYDLDEEVEYIFNQPDVDLDIPFVDEDFVKEYSGYSYRDYQVNSVNSVIKSRKGVLDIGTNGGKTWICVGISKAFDSVLKSVIVVPSENLVKQTYADYKKSGLSVATLTSTVKPDKRADVINSHRHIIITTKLFLNCYESFANDMWALIIDETHTFGEVLASILRMDMAHCPVRVGLTATLPKHKVDPYKRATILGILGGDVLESVSQHELISRGISSQLNIRMVSTVDPEIEELSEEKEFEWTVENSYLLTNLERVDAIASYLKEFPLKNTLILCHAGMATRLGDALGYDVIVDETPVDVRSTFFKKFDDFDDYTLIATFGCAGTGLSINRILRQVMIDVGKNETYIMQGIGRGLRLDGVENKIELFDISSRTKYSKKHRKDRINIYKREKFNFVEEKDFIMVVR